MDCEYHAATGLIKESIRIKPNGFEMELTLPPNVTATVEIPRTYADMKTVCAGVEADGHGFTVRGGKHIIGSECQ